jgi:hypothetical protein
MTGAEIIGYCGMALIALSYFFGKIRTLRLLTIAGGILMAVYGFYIESIPVGVLNTLIVLINVWQLDKMNRESYNYDILDIDHRTNDALDRFLGEYARDIKTGFPEFDQNKFEGKTSLLLRNLTMVGVFIYKRNGDEAIVVLDYVAPAYRDFGNSKHFYTVRLSEFRAQGIQRLRTFTKSPSHERYLKKIGYRKVNESAWVLDL